MELKNKLNKYIDHTLLKPDATTEQITAICQEAVEYHFASVCVNSCHAPLVSSLLKDSDVLTCVVVGFPLGACTTACKVFEAGEAVSAGAAEIDMVINIGKAKEGDWDYLAADIKAVVDKCHSMKAITKVIIETCLLTREEIVKVCSLAEASGADFVKTSTGFSTSGATVEDVALMRQTVSPSVQVKASGGIRDLETALKMIEAGADRIGASAGVAIMRDCR